MKKLFNARALQRRHRLGDRSGPITLLSPPLKATLVVGVVITVAGGFWATLARIPITVRGLGVLLPAGTISTSVSQSDGVAIWLFQKPALEWQQKTWRFQQRPGSFSDKEMAKLASTILEASETHQPSHGAAPPVEAHTLLKFRGTRFSQGRLLLWVQASSQKANLSSALDQLERTLRASDAQQRNIGSQQAGLKREFNSRSTYLTSMKNLEARGFVSRASILEEQATVDGIGSQILSNQNQLIALARDRDQAYQVLRNQLALLVQQQLIFAPRDGYLDQVNAQNGQAVSRGQELLKLSDQPLFGAVLVPMFLGSNETAQVRPGMSALATPAGYKRAEVGGIQARVVFKARLPGNLDTVSARVGVTSLAQQIVAQEPSPTLVILALERAEGARRGNSGGYRWSSRSDLPFPPTPGELLDVEITTRRVHPIDLVLPGLKQLFGLTPPDPVLFKSSRGVPR